MRIGTGYDIHRLVEDRRLVLGGVEIPYHKGLLGHSDADVLSHAIADAILGAAGLHDIGHFFPDTDPKLEGIDSQIILRKAIAEVSHLGYKLQNVDSTLIAQEPKIGPHINSMKRVLSHSLGVTEDSLGIKATTHEGVGDIGKGLAIAAQAACLLVN